MEDGQYINFFISSSIFAIYMLGLLLIGWANLILYACNACLCINAEAFPYKVSPTIGLPIYLECTLIWCVLPVSNKNSI